MNLRPRVVGAAVLLALVGSLLVLSGAPAGAASHSVTSSADSGAGSYRQAILDAAGDGDPIVINFDAGLNIVLTSGDVVYPGTQPITLNGNGSTISGNDSSRILDASFGSVVTVNDLTVVDGFTTGTGGAVRANGPITVNRSHFEGNTADGNGGALENSSGDITITDSTFVGNESDSDGGAIRSSSGTYTIVDSTFSGNTAADNGGAMRTSSGNYDVEGSTFSGNTAVDNGGVMRTSSGSYVMTNSTFTDNTAGGEGGIIWSSSGSATLTHVTAAANEAPDGADVSVSSLESEASVFVDPITGSSCDLDNPVTSNGHNYDTDGSCGFGAGPGDVSGGADPSLGALGDNGGPTETMVPATGSPLIDAIPAADCATGVDQRNIARPQDGDDDGTPDCDIGAVEVAEAVVVPPVDPPVDPPGPDTGPIAAAPTFTG